MYMDSCKKSSFYNVGLVKQVRNENTNASAFGNMKFVKELMSFK